MRSLRLLIAWVGLSWVSLQGCWFREDSDKNILSAATLEATPQTALANGTQRVMLRVGLKPALNVNPADFPVFFQADNESVTIEQPPLTDVNGFAVGYASSQESLTTEVRAWVTLGKTPQILDASVKISFVATDDKLSLRADPDTFATDTQAIPTLTARVESQTGQGKAGVAVSFSSSIVTDKLNANPVVTDAQGVAKTTYSASLVGPHVFEASALGNRASTSVDIVAGAASPANCRILLNPSAIDSSGLDPSDIEVTVLDAYNNPIPNASVSLSTSESSDVISPLQASTDANGVARFTITATLVGTHQLTALVENRALNADLQVIVPPISATQSFILADPNAVVADDATEIVVTIGVRNQYNQAQSGVSVGFSDLDPSDTVTFPNGYVSDSNGLVTAFLRSTSVHQETVVATLGSNVNLSTNVSFVPGPIDAGATTFTLSPNTQVADNSHVIVATVLAKDAYSHGIPGIPVTFSTDGNNNLLSSAAGSTDVTGMYSTTVRTSVAQNENVFATVSALNYTQMATFTPGPVASIALNVSVDSNTYAVKNYASTYYATSYDAFGNLVPNAKIVWSNLGGAEALWKNMTYTNSLGTTSFDSSTNYYGNNTVRASSANVSQSFGYSVPTKVECSNLVVKSRFLPVQTISVGQSPQYAVVADFNINSLPGVAVTNGNGNSITILKNTGSGTLAVHTTITGIPTPQGIAAADFNLDGYTDLIVTNSANASSSIYLLKGTGNGTFAPRVTYTTTGKPFNVAVSDFNKDGYPDIVISTNPDSVINVFLNNKSGGFSAANSYTVGTNGYQIQADDIDNDGNADICVTCSGNGNVYLFYGKGDGTFNAPLSYSVGTGSTGLVTADLNQDGRKEVIVTNGYNSSMNVLTFNSNRSFKSNVGYATGSCAFAWMSGSADFNADSRADVAVACYLDSSARIFLNSGDGRLVQPNSSFGQGSDWNVTAKTLPTLALPIDLNQDGFSDLMVLNSGDSSITAFMQSVDEFTATIPNKPVRLKILPTSFQKGYEGVVALSYAGNQITSMLNYSGYAPVNDASGSGPVDLTIMDVDRDGIQDLCVVNQNNNTLTTHRATITKDANTNLITSVHYNVVATKNIGIRPYRLDKADIDGDGAWDVAIVDGISNIVQVVLGNGDGTFGASSLFSADSVMVDVAMQDFDGDGQPEMALLSQTGNHVSLYKKQSNGTWLFLDQFSTGQSPVSMTSADFDGDGFMDIAVVNQLDNSVSVLFNDGHGNFSTQTTYSVGQSPVSISVGDYNGDSNVDLVVANKNSNFVTILLGSATHNRTFTSLSKYTSVQSPDNSVAYRTQGSAVIFVSGPQASEVRFNELRCAN